MIGDGHTMPLHCEAVDVPADREADAPALYCTPTDTHLSADCDAIDRKNNPTTEKAMKTGDTATIESNGRSYPATLYPISYNIPMGYFAHARGLKAAAIRAGLRPRRGWSVVADVAACQREGALVLATVHREGWHGRLGIIQGTLTLHG